MKIRHTALLAGAAAVLLAPSMAAAQAVQAPVEAAPAAAVTQAVVAPQAVEVVLPANTEVLLTLNEAVATNSHKLGEKFGLTVAQDVKVDGRTVIARGTRAVGQITYRTGKGSFGKSGKMDMVFRYLELDGKQIPLDGRHHQEGEGNSAAAIGAVVAAGLVGGLIVKGRSARVETGREFTVRTAEALPLTLPADGSPAVVAASYTPAPVKMEVETDKERKAREKALKAQAAAKRS